MNPKDKYQLWMNIAINEAKKGILQGEQPYAALLVVDGEIKYLSCSQVKRNKNDLDHAEIIVLRQYLQREKTKAKELILVSTCEPCIKCFSYSIMAGVNKFIYGSSIEAAIKNQSGDILFKIKQLSLKHNFSVVENVLEAECDDLFTFNYRNNNLFTESKGSREEKYWMKKALEIGKKGMMKKQELPIGVILVAGDKILTQSSTMTYTLNSPIIHGDLYAMYLAKRKVYDKKCPKPLVLYSSLEPHLIGFGAAIKCGVDKIVYGLEAYPDGGSTFLKSVNSSKEYLPKIIGGVLEKEQYLLLKEFVNNYKNNRVGYSYALKLINKYEELHK